MFRVILIAMLSLAGSTTLASSPSPEDCIAKCQGPSDACFHFGLATKAFIEPYLLIHQGIQAGSAGKIGDICKQELKTVAGQIRIDGPACSVKKQDIMTSYFPGNTIGEIRTLSSGQKIVYFTAGMPTLEIKNYSSGEVEYVTSFTNNEGRANLVWSNGDLCFSSGFN